MNLLEITEELNLKRLYLEGLSREQILHVIKLTIYFIENDNSNYKNKINSDEIDEINKISLTNDLNNNLFFKYRKVKLNINTVAIIKAKELKVFTNSILINFKIRNPIVVIIENNDQEKVIQLFIKSLDESEINHSFLKVL